MDFTPDYTNLVNAAKNIRPVRMPLYEHSVCDEIMEKITGKKFAQLRGGNTNEKREYYTNIAGFYKLMGYDTISFECGIASVMPGSGALTSHRPGAIKSREDFDKYPWDCIHDKFFDAYSKDFEILARLCRRV